MKKKATGYNYGECEICNTPLQEKLKELHFYRPESKLGEHKQAIEGYFREYPPATIKEAMSAIEKLTGLKCSEKQVLKFVRKIGIRCRQGGTIPSKANVVVKDSF